MPQRRIFVGAHHTNYPGRKRLWTLSLYILLAMQFDLSSPSKLSNKTVATETEAFVRSMVGQLWKERQQSDTARVEGIERKMQRLVTSVEVLVAAMNATTLKLRSLESSILKIGNLSSRTDVAKVGNDELRWRNLSQLVNHNKNTINVVSKYVDRMHPIVCGGVLVGAAGELKFEAPTSVDYNFTCVWTIRAETFERTNVTLLEHNLAVSTSKLRLTAITDMLYDAPFNASLSQTIWDGGSKGVSHSFSGYGVIVELIVSGGAGARSKFHLIFSGSGSSKFWAGRNFGNYHFNTLNGTATHRNYKNDERMSFVITPKGSTDRNVTLTKRFFDLEKCDEIGGCDFLRIWSIGSQSLLGHKDTRFRLDGSTDMTSLNSSTDNVGWVVMFHSDGTNVKRGFSLDFESKYED